MENFQIEKVSDEGEIGHILENEILWELCPRYILIGEERTCLAEEYIKYANEIKNLEVHNEDIWIASYPKTGTTWSQEMIWLIVNNLDYDRAKTQLVERFSFLEASSVMDSKKFKEITKIEVYFSDTVNFVKNSKSPRFIKTHLPFSLLPDQIKHKSKTPKIIYVTRNVKDTCVSFYHHYNLCQGARTNAENFAKVFIAERVMYGSFWKHNLGFWEQKDLMNILFLKYEDMKKNLTSVIKNVAQFLNKSLNDEQVHTLTKHLSFDNFKKNPAVNGEPFLDILRKNNLVSEEGSFVRSGIVGKYKEELKPETIYKLDEWTKTNISGTSFEKFYNCE